MLDNLMEIFATIGTMTVICIGATWTNEWFNK
jgi:hypothetical protein